MNTYKLTPEDLLFFKDGRPIEGQLSGQSMPWPTPDIVNHALLSALHRSKLLENAYQHDYNQPKSSAAAPGEDREHNAVQAQRKLGNLVSVGPFPLRGELWHFPRPLDLESDSLQASCVPCDFKNATSSLPTPLKYAVTSKIAPSKDNPAKHWLDAEAYKAYLHHPQKGSMSGVNNTDINHHEFFTGIAIDAASGVAGTGEADGKIYSAQYLRFKPDWSMGVLAAAEQKQQQGDLITQLCEQQQNLVVGGRQRTCRIEQIRLQQPLPLPCGINEAPAACADGKVRIKWVLLTPAIFPHMPANSDKGIAEHQGGWLPNWVCNQSGKVMLKADLSRRPGQSRAAWRSALQKQPFVEAALVAVRSEKPQIITGYASAESASKGGAKSTHLAVPAGSVYYFECANSRAAGELLKLLNWHGELKDSAQILNRRSTLLGEKGFGIGVCAGWQLL